jgi:hypothetical protein
MDFLQPHDGPVIPGREKDEVVYAKDQPEYRPLRALVEDPDGERRVISRWTLTDEQRKSVANGADIFLSVLTFGRPLQPILMAIDKIDSKCIVDGRTYKRHKFVGREKRCARCGAPR